MRDATAVDLPAVNGIVERAVNTWKLPERVKRLAMPSYRYNVHDLTHLRIVVAEDDAAHVLGVAAWEEAAARDCPAMGRGLLLHGIYVDPDRQRNGVGRRLLSAATAAAREEGFDGLLVKAHADADAFFRSQGLRQLAVGDANRDYPHRFWMELTAQRPA